MVALAGPAAAADPACGATVTTNVVLAADVGPCTGNGIIVGANNITINLNGHSVIGNNTLNTTSVEQVGILGMGHRNVQVRNGTVRNFDSGVAVVKGSKNTVRDLTVRDNINHSSFTGAINKCKYGDGITITGSEQNVVQNNIADHNGPFSGIALVGVSSGNMISGNTAVNQTVANELPPAGSGVNGPCGPFSATPTGAGRLYQDIGIRVEGPGALNNQVLSNTSTDNTLNGISIHGYVCGTFPGGPTPGSSNTGNLIQGNDVRRNGFQPDGATIDGIGILRQGPFGTVVCASHGNSIIANTSTGNARDGIFVPPTGDVNFPSANNTVNQNRVNGNGRDGIHVDGPFTVCPIGQGNSTAPTFCNVPREDRPGSTDNTLISNRGRNNGIGVVAPALGHDGFDGNPRCDHNFWQQNIFTTVNQACVTNNFGTGTEIGPIP